MQLPRQKDHHHRHLHHTIILDRSPKYVARRWNKMKQLICILISKATKGYYFIYVNSVIQLESTALPEDKEDSKYQFRHYSIAIIKRTRQVPEIATQLLC
ncbi:hypothetical protein J6590_030248 [Homalodisca vitripennis]|nr:hypothetical protein J6590_030248 [Homalodisca vitripennis]